MRILLLVDCYLPSRKSGAKHIHDLAVELHGLGHQVTVLTPCDFISEGLQLTHEAGLRIVRVRVGRTKGTPKPVRAVQEVRLPAVLWRRARRFLIANPADLIIYYSPTIFFGTLVRRLKSLWHCPSYLILRDIFPQWAVDLGLLRKGLVWRFFRSKEISQYDAANIVAVQSQGDLDYFAHNFPPNRYRLEVLYNWTPLRESDLPRTKYRDRLGLRDKVVFFFGGNLGVAQDMDNLVRLAANLTQHSQIHFLLVGEGSEVPGIKNAIANRGLHNIQIVPAVAQREYLAMLSEFDVGLLSLNRRLGTHNIPGKLLSYMYWGMPILASINPGNDLFALLDRHGAGFCFVNGDDRNLSAAALRLAMDCELRNRMGQNARNLLENVFSVGAAAQEIINHFLPAAWGREPAEDMLGSKP